MNVLDYWVTPINPAKPPGHAINTSQIVGEIRDNSSDLASCRGDSEKYEADTIRLMTVYKQIRQCSFD